MRLKELPHDLRFISSFQVAVHQIKDGGKDVRRETKGIREIAISRDQKGGAATGQIIDIEIAHAATVHQADAFDFIAKSL